MTDNSPGRLPIRAKAAAMLAGLSLLLSACFITPGKFSSELELTGEDSFTFTYEGEIFFLGLSDLAQMGAAGGEFEPTECYDEEDYSDRECTEAELAQQREDWEAGAEARAAKAKKDAEAMAVFMGGIDVTDPEASEELRQLLLRQKGWNRVEDKGDGVYDVSYTVSGKLSHDFLFPTIEEVPTTNPFVQIVLRDDNVVRVNAPGFSAQSDTNPMAAMFGGMGSLAGLAALGDEGAAPSGEMPNIPAVEGTFSIVTDGRILANNTDTGPVAEASDTSGIQTLEWEITPRTKAAPTALVDLSR